MGQIGAWQSYNFLYPQSTRKMLGKAIEKSKTRRTHTRNYTAGEVVANKRYLERTGIRGKKRWALLLAITILAVIVLGNFIVRL